MIYRHIVTSEVRAWIDKQNFGKDILERLDGFLSSGNETNATPITGNTFISKIVNHSGPRFIWFQHIEKSVCLYILRRIYKHDEYSRKFNEATKDTWIEKHALSDAETAEVNNLIKRYSTETKKEFLPEEYRDFEGERAFDKYRDIVIYEMPLWHDGIKKTPKEYWSDIQKTLSSEDLYNGVQRGLFLSRTINKYTITYRFGDSNAKDKSDIYLLQVVKGNEPNIKELIDRQYDCADVNDLKNKSTKCYPDYYTYEYDSWKDVEEDDMANLALSEEEIEVLKNVRFPFFVSGLAGSGKSTILYYLFANIYKHVSKRYPDHELLFLSYNDSLVDKARRAVRSILCYHSSNEGTKENFEDPEYEKRYNKCFVPFREFLKQTFLDELDIERFSEDKHITYEKFREDYKKCIISAGKRLSPAVLWSIIRTFIKGRRLNIFTPKDYNSDVIAKKDKTVDSKTYERAYDIWEKWYKSFYENKGYWDDLDLVRYVLNHGDTRNNFRKYAVIFCDEAQDFTKLEIDLILNLSKHSDYNLSGHEADKRIPIAFAGDPNQTINPTGFRWAGTKALFSESFKDSLDGHPDLDIKELSKNYRSQLGIVKFANTIQSLRYKHFDDTSKERKLQSVREDPKGENKDALEYVGFYSYDQNKDIIIENLPNANIIVSGDGEEGDLKDYPEITDDGIKLGTAIGTKGLEYDAVMLYKFCSDPSYTLFQKIVKGEPFADDSERFEIAHFFTKLYIAVSRAKSQLFIVDTDNSYENFWKYFTNHNLWQTLIDQYVKDEYKRKLVGHITNGDIETLPQRLSESYDAEENGRQEFEKANGNPPSILHMKRAHDYFLEAGLTALADECDAYIHLYNSEFEAAGDKFQELSKIVAAADAYWNGMCWAKLLPLYSRGFTSPTDHIRSIIAQFMTDKIKVSQLVQELVDKRDDFQTAISEFSKEIHPWKASLELLKQKLRALTPVEVTAALTKNLDVLSDFIIWFDNGLAPLRAHLNFVRAEFNNTHFSKNEPGFNPDGYERCVSICEQNGLPQKDEYFKSKKLLSKSDSEEIKWMNYLNEQGEIISRFGDVTVAPTLTPDAAGIVFSCLLNKDYRKAITYPYPKEQSIKWDQLYAKDKGKFLIDVVLNEFSMEKFYFLSDKVQSEDESIFDNLPSSIFDEIFSLTESDGTGRPYWTFFANMKNAKGERVLKSNTSNQIAALDALSKKILADKNYDKAIASCFIDVLFDRNYGYQRADKYVDTISHIFEQDVFFKEDFRWAPRRNKYFAVFCDLDPEQYETLKTNVRKYVQGKFAAYKKVSTNNEAEFKALCNAYEICVAYQVTEPDYISLCNFYNSLKRDNKFAVVKDWIEQRRLFNQLADDNMLQKASFVKFANEFKERGFDLESFAEGLTKEDAALFVAAANANQEDYSYKRTLISAKLIYKNHLKRESLKPFCRVNELVAKLRDDIDVAIDELLSEKGRLDEYALKVLSFTWEALFDHAIAANQYDKLVGKKRLARMRIMTEYLKKRALLHYYYYRKQMFESKQEEYGISMSSSYLPSVYPKIEERSSTKDESTEGDTATATAKISENTEELSVDAVNIVRNMKRANMPASQIQAFVPQLSIEEIEKL